MSSVGIIINPKHASTYRAYGHLVQELQRAGVHYRTLTTSIERSSQWQAETLIDWGAEAVIILGGDGTIRMAAPTLAEADMLTFLIPTGTANVLSRHIGLHSAGHAIDHCVTTVASMTAAGTAPVSEGTSTMRRVPINSAYLRRADDTELDTHFISLAGIGGDAHAVAHHPSAPGLLGYALGAARALFASDFTVRTGEAASGNVWSVMASKVARPAGPIAVFPAAVIDANTFSTLTVGPLPDEKIDRSRAWAGIVAACLQGRAQAHPLMDYRRTSEVTVELESPMPVHLDGDLIGDCLKFEVSAGITALRVSAPAA